MIRNFYRIVLLITAIAFFASSVFALPQGRLTGAFDASGFRSNTVTGITFSSTYRQLTTRLFRSASTGALPGTCDTPQPVPTQANVSGVYNGREFVFTSPYTGCMTVTAHGHGRARISAAAYAGSFVNFDPKANLIAYSGDWARNAGETAFFSFRVVQGQTYVIVVWDTETSGSTLNDGYDITINDSLAVSSDFDGDGQTDSAVFRPSNSAWFILRSSDATVAVDFFGSNGDVPMDGDFDGDGKSDLATFRPSNGTWYYKRSSNNTVFGAFFGLGTDKPVPGDYDRDGITDIGAYRDGQWLLSPSSGSTLPHTTVTGYSFGSAGDIPVGSQRK